VSQLTVGWLLLAAALLTFGGGFGLRTALSRNRDKPSVRRSVTRFRETGFARLMFGRATNDALDDEELDQMIIMPAIVIACGLCLTAVFVLGIEVLT
jgi:hypothetical protein